jgi:hypothetical protein
LIQLFLKHGKAEDVAELKTYFPDGETKITEAESKGDYEDTVDWIAR